MNHKKRVSTKQKQYKLYIYLDFLASKLRSNDFIILPRYTVISKLSPSPRRLRYFPRFFKTQKFLILCSRDVVTFLSMEGPSK